MLRFLYLCNCEVETQQLNLAPLVVKITKREKAERFCAWILKVINLKARLNFARLTFALKRLNSTKQERPSVCPTVIMKWGHSRKVVQSQRKIRFRWWCFPAIISLLHLSSSIPHDIYRLHRNFFPPKMANSFSLVCRVVLEETALFSFRSVKIKNSWLQSAIFGWTRGRER